MRRVLMYGATAVEAAPCVCFFPLLPVKSVDLGTREATATFLFLVRIAGRRQATQVPESERAGNKIHPVSMTFVH